MKEFHIRRYRSDIGAADSRVTLIRIADNGLITYADHQAELILGYTANALEGKPILHIAAADQDDFFAPAQRHRFADGKHVLITLRHKDGFFFTAHVTLQLHVRDADKPASAKIELRNKLTPDPQLQQLVELSGKLGSWELSVENNRLTWSEGIYRLLNLRAGSDITPEQALFYCQGKQDRVRALFRRCLRTGRPFSIELDLITARQRIRHIRLTGQALKCGQQVTRLAGTAVDQTRTRQHDQSRRDTERLLHAIMSTSQDLIAVADRQLNLLQVNEAYQRIFARAFAVMPRVGDNLSVLLAPFANAKRLNARLWQRAFERSAFQTDMPMGRRSRPLPSYEVRFEQLLNKQGEVIAALQIARKVSPQTVSAGTQEHLSQHDPVTGLLNQGEFLARLEQVLNQTTPEAPKGGLVFIDLDNFTPINANAGNDAGDRYLRELAAVMGLKARQNDLLARLVGDTFAFWIDNCGAGQARQVAQKLIDAIADFKFDWQGSPLQTTASAGLVIVDGSAPKAPEPLLSEAAGLCHTAKSAGRNRVHADKARHNVLTESERQHLLAHLQYCLDNDGIVLHYQRIHPVASATWGDHIEILARINGYGAAASSLQPDAFLPIADQFDLGKQLDRQIIHKTLKWLNGQPSLIHRLKYCGFNLSLASVLDESLADFIQSALAGSPFAADTFCFEINEADASRYPDEVAILCDSLHTVGCRVALDGAGASVESYNLAGKLPVDIVKLDRTMMQKLQDDPVQQVMVEALHKIARAAGKQTVATFIENKDTLRYARKLGIHFGQGFHLAKPKPLTHLIPAAITAQAESGE